MNANTIINMVIRQVMRRVIGGGINAGINAVGKKMGSANAREDHAPVPGSTDAQKRMRQSMRSVRKLGRF